MGTSGEKTSSKQLFHFRPSLMRKTSRSAEPEPERSESTQDDASEQDIGSVSAAQDWLQQN